ncbi:MAG: hypothetical protein ACR652_08225 [Methylocystis sp.]|uniref:hypothetical protein n=1 Tax=Methylocystis sp. TaxID=1911079 RepID=UPI003DA1CCBF
MRDRGKTFRPGVLAASAVAALLLAGHIHGHLGDYTAERGLPAVARIGGICAALGAMVFLILETTLRALESLFPDG